MYTRRCLLPAWGFGAAPAHPRDLKIDSLLVGAGKKNIPLGAVLRGGRVPSLASLVANGCFWISMRYLILENNTPFLDRTQSRNSSRNSITIRVKFRNFMFLVNTGPYRNTLFKHGIFFRCRETKAQRKDRTSCAPCAKQKTLCTVNVSQAQ